MIIWPNHFDCCNFFEIRICWYGSFSFVSTRNEDTSEESWQSSMECPLFFLLLPTSFFLFVAVSLLSVFLSLSLYSNHVARVLCQVHSRQDRVIYDPLFLQYIWVNYSDGSIDQSWRTQQKKTVVLLRENTIYILW